MALIEEATVVNWCEDPYREIIGGADRFTKVIKVGNLAIKFGNVFEEEAENQREACRLLDFKVLRVPIVQQFFRHEGMGYLIMEYIEGAQMDAVDDQDTLAIARCIEYLHTFSSDRPGPLRDGKCRGLLWSEDDPPVFCSSEEVEAYINSRLVDQKPEFRMSSVLHLCHLDPVPRNILKSLDGTPVLLDWASAGYYPRIFEIAALRRNHGENGCQIEFCNRLIRSICETSPLEGDDCKQIDLILEFAFNDIRYCFVPTVATRSRRRRKKIQTCDVPTVATRSRRKRKKIQTCDDDEGCMSLGNMTFPGPLTDLK